MIRYAGLSAFWKPYAIFMFLFVSLTRFLPWFLRYPDIDSGTYIDILNLVLSLIGLFLYAFSMPFLSVYFWRLLFIIILILDFRKIYYGIELFMYGVIRNYLETGITAKFLASYGADVFFALLHLPIYIALYFYAFRSASLWVRAPGVAKATSDGTMAIKEYSEKKNLGYRPKVWLDALGILVALILGLFSAAILLAIMSPKNEQTLPPVAIMLAINATAIFLVVAILAWLLPHRRWGWGLIFSAPLCFWCLVTTYIVLHPPQNIAKGSALFWLTASVLYTVFACLGGYLGFRVKMKHS